MIPLRDSIKPETFPYVNISIIIVNFLIFFWQLTLESYQLNQVYYIFGVVPAETLNDFFVRGTFLSSSIPFLTAMFFHGGWIHVIGNMLYLWIFGDNIEDRMGHFRYLLFYFGVGIIASIVHVLANSTSTVPVVGASGAVAGILGAYIILFPRSKILSLIPIFFFLTVVEVPALLFIAVWFLIQLFSGFAFLGGTASTVAWWAHIGGFVAGAVLVKFLASPGREKVYS